MRNKLIIHKCLLTGLLFICLSVPAAPLVNSWTNPMSAPWEGSTNWSLALVPASNQMVTITNDGYKAVDISPSTPINFPASMTVSNLTVSAPSNALSTLLLNYPGTATPLLVLNGCTISTNGSLDNFYGAFEVDSGQWNITGGQFIQEGGTTLATNATTSVLGGNMNLTNADVNLGPLLLGVLGGASSGVVTQAGGSVDCTLVVRAGSYNLLSGSFSGECFVSGPQIGGFSQYGGTNYSTITLGQDPSLTSGGFGSYTLYNGAVIASNLNLGPIAYAGGEFNQAEGFVSVASLNLGSTGSVAGQGTYSLTNGVLLTGNVNMLNGGIIQSGGQHTTSNSLALFGYFDAHGLGSRAANYSLSGGVFFCPGINMGFFGSFNQSGGTNLVAGDLSFVTTSYTLSSGTLLTSNTLVSDGYVVTQGGPVYSQFFQSGGEHRVSNTLSNLGQYFLSGGTLSATNIVLGGTLSVSNSAVILNPGSFNFRGNLQLFNNASENLGQALLSGNSSIDFEPGTHTLAFLNSSPVSWSNGVTLAVSNWTGLTNGGGSDQLFFGNDSSGLTQAELRQIEFVNPSGFPAGVYPAKILATGEVVPAPRPMLLSSRNSHGVILNWSGGFVLQTATNLAGPYSDITGASSPYTNQPLLPQQFFRLRQ